MHSCVPLMIIYHFKYVHHLFKYFLNYRKIKVLLLAPHLFYLLTLKLRKLLPLI